MGELWDAVSFMNYKLTFYCLHKVTWGRGEYTKFNESPQQQVGCFLTLYFSSSRLLQIPLE